MKEWEREEGEGDFRRKGENGDGWKREGTGRGGRSRLRKGTHVVLRVRNTSRGYLTENERQGQAGRQGNWRWPRDEQIEGERGLMHSRPKCTRSNIVG